MKRKGTLMLSNFDFENNIYDTEENSHVEFLGNDDAEGSEFKFINMSFFFLFHWDSLHPRLNSHYKIWNYKKKKHKRIKTQMKSV